MCIMASNAMSSIVDNSNRKRSILKTSTAVGALLMFSSVFLAACGVGQATPTQHGHHYALPTINPTAPPVSGSPSPTTNPSGGGGSSQTTCNAAQVTGSFVGTNSTPVSSNSNLMTSELLFSDMSGTECTLSGVPSIAPVSTAGQFVVMKSVPYEGPPGSGPVALAPNISQPNVGQAGTAVVYITWSTAPNGQSACPSTPPQIAGFNVYFGGGFVFVPIYSTGPGEEFLPCGSAMGVGPYIANSNNASP